ncbi:MAG: glycosyltransferase [Nanobdellota archaeon]
MGLYIQLHSMHGLFRSHNLELGRDEDTGGQIVYVLELAKALGKMKQVDEVEIITRRIEDKNYPGYYDAFEKITDKVRIVRIECGPKGYMKKVKLWPYINEFTKNVKAYISKKGRVPDVFQSNYADSGLVCSKLAKDYNRPQIHTGHSLGKSKMQRLGVNKNNYARLDKIFNFTKRIKAEQEAINNSAKIITSTYEEIKHQYTNYDIKGKSHKFIAIPPGIDLKRFYPPKKNNTKEEKHTYELLDNILDQNLKNPKKSLLSVLTRLDKRKNLHGLLKAFGSSRELKRLSNFLVFADTLSIDNNIKDVITSINSTIRENNLYDKIAIPGISLSHQHQVPAFYRYLAKNGGVFVNPALVEPFGITILEAGACGVPVVATKIGGPSEIIEDGVNGLLVDPKDQKDISKKIIKLTKERMLWNKISKNAVKNIKNNYSWKKAAEKYLAAFKEVI